MIKILPRPFRNVHDIKGFGLGLSYERKLLRSHGTIKAESQIGKRKSYEFFIQNRHIWKTKKSFLLKMMNNLGVLLQKNYLVIKKLWCNSLRLMARGSSNIQKMNLTSVLLIMMPEMDGLTLAKEVRKYKQIYDHFRLPKIRRKILLMVS